MPAVLEVEDLTVEFATPAGYVTVVDRVGFALEAGGALAIVGESGCGKSVTAMATLRVLAEPPARIAAGRVGFEGRDLMGLDETTMRTVRGRDIAMIFQEPMTSLNPVLTIGEQVGEVLVAHQGLAPRAAREKALELLKAVRIPDAARRLDDYPHRLSGGMRQRVMIAIALACTPKVLIADEPTTALDVTVQAQILALRTQLQQEAGIAIVLITHNLAVVAQVAERVAVMYAGRIVESGAVADILARPLHPYTQGLLGATPRFDGHEASGAVRARLADIPGTVPQPGRLPPGCAFAPRCTKAIARCRSERPDLAAVSPGHAAACFLAEPAVQP